MMVEKKDGKLKPFDENCIRVAMLKAASSIGGHIPDIEVLLSKIVKKFEHDAGPIPIIKIHDQVEHILQCSSHKDIAKSYIMYRHDRDVARESKGKLLQNIEDFQVNTLTTTNGQTPFISISFGLGTNKFERLLTEMYLQVHQAGLGKDKVTPVFPKVILISSV